MGIVHAQFILSLVFLLFLGLHTNVVAASESSADATEELVGTLTQNPLLSEQFVRSLLFHPDIEKTESQLANSCVALLEDYGDTYTLLGDRSLQIGEEFYQRHETIFTATKETYGIDSQYILGILRVETYFGMCTGEYRVLPRLYYLYKTVPEKKSFALREIEAFLELVIEYNWDPFSVWGSSMGAIGVSQFLPSSIKNFAVDGNADGKIDMFDAEDMIPSIAHYLVINHFKINKRAGIWNYNRSNRYVRRVLRYAEKIKEKIQ